MNRITLSLLTSTMICSFPALAIDYDSYSDGAVIAECGEHGLMTQISNNKTFLRAMSLATGEVVDDFEYQPYVRINGIGYNTLDNHYYGMDMSTKELLKIIIKKNNSDDVDLPIDYELERIPLPDLVGTNYRLYVADVVSGYWYGFSNPNTLIRINLNEGADQYNLEVVGSGSNLSNYLGDMAYNEIIGEEDVTGDNMFYGVGSGRKGGDADLIRIDPTTGQNTNLGNLGISDPGFFGATYFDNSGNLYVANNKTGNVYKIDIPSINSGTNPSDAITLSANGFSAQGNDGARCQQAALPTEDFDYGHAPRSSSLSGLDFSKSRYAPTYSLGESVEVDLSDIVNIDSDYGQDSGDDGVFLASGVTLQNANVEEDMVTEITVKVSGGLTYVSGWIDFNNNEIFEDSEQVLDAALAYPKGHKIITTDGDEIITTGETNFNIDVPNGVELGTTWVRFRSSDVDMKMSPYGASGPGEVEDYQINLTNTIHENIYFPSKDGFATVAFEDKWPEQADYDFNDVVIKYRQEFMFENNYLRRIDIVGQVAHYGAKYNNGFGFELMQYDDPTNFITTSQIESKVFDSKIGGPSETLPNVVLRHNTEEIQVDVDHGLDRPTIRRQIIVPEDVTNDTLPAVVRIFDDIKEVIDDPSFDNTCIFDENAFYRTSQLCGLAGDDLTFSVSIPIKDLEISKNDALVLLKPFIFSSPNDLRYSDLLGYNDVVAVKDRKLEIHLKNNDQTVNSESSLLFGSSADRSNGSTTFFLDDNGMPWGLLFSHEWYPPRFGLPITDAYPKFRNFVESGGTLDQDWYTEENRLSTVNDIVSDEVSAEPSE